MFIKFNFYLYVFSTVFLVSMFSHSALWIDTESWSNEWEEKYQDWVSSENLKEDIFTNKNSPYYGIQADCADVAYAFRVIFSYENKLPFSVKNPIGSANYKTFSNQLDRFDKTSDSNKKIVAFINFIGSSFGTESLSANDSYPIQLSKISPADFFMYKITSKGQIIRHTYYIKNITDKGFFNLIYSTQDKKHSGAPLSIKKDQELKYRPRIMNWGFKRFKQPDWIGQNLSEIAQQSDRDYSLEQYEIAQKVSTDKEFFKIVRQSLNVSEETPTQLIERIIKNVCGQAQDRIEVVLNAVEFVKNKNGACLLDFTEYDTYSTPVRDERFKEAFKAIRDAIEELRDQGSLAQVSSSSLEIAESIISKKELTDSEKSTLIQFCSINYGGTHSPLNLNTIYKNIENGTLSSHPNDNLERRWGFSEGKKTNCKVIY